MELTQALGRLGEYERVRVYRCYGVSSVFKLVSIIHSMYYGTCMYTNPFMQLLKIETSILIRFHSDMYA